MVYENYKHLRIHIYKYIYIYIYIKVKSNVKKWNFKNSNFISYVISIIIEERLHFSYDKIYSFPS